MGKVTFTASIEFANEAEVQLATELIKTIQQITSNFTTTVVGADGPSSVPQSAVKPPAESPQPFQAQPQTPAAVQLHQPPTSHSHPKPIDEVSILSVVKRLGEVEGRSEAVLDLQRYLDRKGDEGFQEFFDTYIGVIFHADVAQRPRSPQPFLEAILSLSDKWIDAIRKQITPRMLKLLTQKRAVAQPRHDIAAYAEAFAILVEHKVVAAAGAVKTMAMLLANQDNKAAAALMLARTAQHCPSLPAMADTAELRSAFQKVTEVELREDVLAVSKAYGWLPGVVGGMRVPGGLAEVMLHSRSYQVKGVAAHGGHNGAVFSVTVDPGLGQVITTAKDGSVLVRDYAGVEVQRLELARHYGCSADISHKHAALLLSGVAREPGPAPSITVCTRVHADQDWQWKMQGQIERPEMKIVTCVKAIAEERGCLFATGEQISSSVGAARRECVCIYDISQQLSSSLSNITPLAVYEDHDEIITCLAPHPSDPASFFSGSKDSTIRCWDSRVKHAVACLGGPSAPPGSTCHSGMITCLDTCGHSVISAGLDQQLLLWDLRNIRQPGALHVPSGAVALEQQAILKIAAVESGSGMLVAVSSVKGLFVIRLSDSKVVRAQLPSSRANFLPYHDVKWSALGLWAAGEDRSLDLFHVLPE